MSRLPRLSLLALLLGSVSVGLGACQALAGIEDRTFVGSEAGATGDGGPSQQCQDYCKLAKEVCVDTNTLYASDETCLAVCNLWLPGEKDEPKGTNTVACRENQLALAKQTNEPSTIPDYCAKASPGGNGFCGSTCESYCQLYAAACKEDQPQLGSTQYDEPTCVAKCKGLADTKSFDVNANYTGDTLQCRLVHTSAATINPGEHCAHAQLQAQGQAKPVGPCVDDAAVTDPDCDSYCQLETTECTGDFQVFESVAQCKAVCNALPLGKITDIKENTVGCRKYHSYNALVDPMTHCSHTGPTGDGHCGANVVPGDGAITGNCESYCILAERACGQGVAGLPAADAFTTVFGTQAACQQACGDIKGAGPNSGYSVNPPPEGDTVQCRTLHATRALSKPVEECAAALGGAPCK